MSEVTQQCVSRLLALRGALEACSDMNDWLSGLAETDLESLGYLQSDAQDLQSAFADAAALAQLYTEGTLPGSYTLPYTFGASQRQIIGPL